jgi:DNA-binding NarL/FixJ family response regulator
MALAVRRGLVRARYRAMLERKVAIEVVAEAAGGQQAIEQPAATARDIALLDAELPASTSPRRRLRSSRVWRSTASR